MGYPEDNEVDPKERERAKKLAKEKVRQELAARGYTEIDFEVMETRGNRVLEQARVQRTLSRFKFDFSDIVPTKKPGT